MPVLSRYNAETDSSVRCSLGRYDPTSESSADEPMQLGLKFSSGI